MSVDPRIESLIADTKTIIARDGVTRESLRLVWNRLNEIAGIRELWVNDRYPPPAPSEERARYAIRADDDQTYALYLNVMWPGERIPPHNHTTWACVASVEGSEFNSVYSRIDGGTGPGPATIQPAEEIEVRPGVGVQLLPDDIHSVQIKGSTPIRHLHLYGRALESLDSRLVFDPTTNSAKIFELTVKSRK